MFVFTSASSASATPSVAAPVPSLAVGNVDPDGASLQAGAVVLQRLAQGLGVVKLHVAETLELVRLSVTDQTHVAHLEIQNNFKFYFGGIFVISKGFFTF